MLARIELVYFVIALFLHLVSCELLFLHLLQKAVPLGVLLGRCSSCFGRLELVQRWLQRSQGWFRRLNRQSI